jgi:hypothetical protein
MHAPNDHKTDYCIFAKTEINKYDLIGEILQRPFLCTLANLGWDKRRPYVKDISEWLVPKGLVRQRTTLCVEDSSEWHVSKGPGETKDDLVCGGQQRVTFTKRPRRDKGRPCVWRTTASDLYQKAQVRQRTTCVWRRAASDGQGETKDDLGVWRTSASDLYQKERPTWDTRRPCV